MKLIAKKPLINPWMIAEDIPDIDMFFAQIWLSAFVNNMSKSVRLNYQEVMCVFRGTNIKFYYRQKDSEKFSTRVFALIKAKPDFGEKINENIILCTDRLVEFAESIRNMNLRKLSNEELWAIWQKHDELHTELYTWGWLPNVTDMFHGNFTAYLKKYLLSKGLPADSLNEYLVTLTNPSGKSIINLEREEFLKLTTKVRQVKDIAKTLSFTPERFISALPEVFFNLLTQHWERWHHLKYNFVGPNIITIEEYAQEIQDVLKSGVDPYKLLKKEEEKRVLDNNKKQALFLKIKPDARHKALFDLWGHFMLTKFYRRNGQIRTIAILRKLLLETSHRLDVPLLHVRTMLYSQIKQALLSGRLNKRAIIKQAKLCVYYANNKQEILLVGRKADLMMKDIPQASKIDVSELKGQCGSLGKAIGVVKLVFRPHDIAKMNKGDILVSIATDPDIVPAMKLAGAIVTDQGGVTAHAAIVSRELGKPCLIGTKIATKIFKDGDRVEVDATKGIIKKID